MIDFFSRLDNYMKYKGLNDNKITVDTGISNGLIGKARVRGALSQENISKILYKYSELDANWLLTGKGEMLKSDNTSAQLVQDDSLGIPLVGVSAIGGFGSNSFSILPQDVKEYYKIPKFANKKIDFMIEVEGSSMYPKYSSGDIVACTIISESSFIQWNKTHVIATQEQGIIIKRVKKGVTDESLCMVSDNVSYDPFEVPKNEINGLALVVGVIRLE
jgi:phage repressor protein C with HTH and peptisase S24 domain